MKIMHLLPVLFLLALAEPTPRALGNLYVTPDSPTSYAIPANDFPWGKATVFTKTLNSTQALGLTFSSITPGKTIYVFITGVADVSGGSRYNFPNDVTWQGTPPEGGTGSALTNGKTIEIMFTATGTTSATVTGAVVGNPPSVTALSNNATAIDFYAGLLQSETITGNITYTTSNLSAGGSVVLRIIADSGGPYNFTFPGGWTFIGAAAPASIAASKIAILSLTSFGTADADVIAAYAVQP